MKRVYRLCSLCFALCLLLSLAVSALAEGEIGHIEPQQPPETTGTIVGAAVGAPLSYLELFVSENGDDAGDGSRQSPFRSLARAAEAANEAEQEQIYVLLLSDLTVTGTARFHAKDVLLMSDLGTFTVRRGDPFDIGLRPDGTEYNPAMIEVSGGRLTVENLILDDAALRAGEFFETVEGEDVLSVAQQAIVSLSGEASFVLGSNGQLRNFGGLSAVYAEEGCKVTLDDYSVIGDTITDACLRSDLRAVRSSSLSVAEKAAVYERSDVPGSREVELPGLHPGVDERDEANALSTLSFTAPKTVISSVGTLSYSIPYSVTLMLSDRAVSLLQASAGLIESVSGTITVQLDDRLNVTASLNGDFSDYTFTSPVFNISSCSYNFYNHTITAKYSLVSNWQQMVDKLTDPMVFSFEALLAFNNFAYDEYLVSTCNITLTATGAYGNNREIINLTDVPQQEAKTKMLPPPSATVHYDPNGGFNGPEDEFVSAQTAYELTTEGPEHEPMGDSPVVFIGWTLEPDTKIYQYGDEAPKTVAAMDIAENGEYTVYAVYGVDDSGDGEADVNQSFYTLSYDANGGEGAPEPETKASKTGVGAKFDISEVEPTWQYHSFQGWSKDPDATEAEYKYDAEHSADRDLIITEDTTLYAVWTENPKYYIYYNANGGTNAPEATVGYSENNVAEMVITDGVPTRSGYVFVGWSSTRRGEAEYFAGQTVRISNGNVMLYAVWVRDTGTGSGGGSGSGSGSGNSGTAPSTGDESHPGRYAAVALLSLGALTGLAVYGRRKQKA